MKYLLFLSCCLLLLSPAKGQTQHCFSDTTRIYTEGASISGTLLLPPGKQTKTVALIIAGSGPTNRDGNGTNGMEAQLNANSYKLLAEALCAKGIASFRYDKRGIGQSTLAVKDEAQHTFTHFVEDAAAVLSWLRAEKGFKKIVVIGHSEGSLVGMLAAQQAKADGLISIAGPGSSIDEILRQQLSQQPVMVSAPALAILDSLAAGKPVEQVPPMLYSVFRPSVQPFLISWMKYQPTEEIQKLEIPILIVQGTTDIQVKEAEAQKLAAAQPKAKLVIVENMNHVLKEAPAQLQANLATYTQAALPLAPEFTGAVIGFITKI